MMNDTVTTPEVYRIPEANWLDFNAKIAKLQARAAKLNAGTITVSKVGEEVFNVIIDRDNLQTREIPVGVQIPANARVKGQRTIYLVTVSGEAPKLNGWRFVGTLEHLAGDNGEVINILRNVPGETIPASFRQRPQWCDHCKTQRRRFDTYVVAHEDGRVAQVGSDCLKDFLGHQSPENIARFAQYLIEIGAVAESEMSGSVGGRLEVYTLDVLALAAARIRVKGWLSRSKAREIAEAGERYPEATADKVETYMTSVKPDGREEQARDGVEVTPADLAEAQAALDWIRSRGTEELDRSEYMWNLYAATRTDTMTWRVNGIICSLIAAWQREQGRQAERKARNAQWANSQFIGTLKKRETFRLKLVAEPVHYANDFGGSYLYRMEDKDGNQVVWWNSGAILIVEARRTDPNHYPQWEVGEWLNVKATVVKHEERNGVKQTTVNRLAIA